ncbi:hypothetical protein MMC30_005323 [Trapelia coarctata]|nr:hypothetical protein [Trapelia coarctata]
MSSRDEDAISHVLDLPSLHSRPSVAVLIDVLNALALKPPTFDGVRHGKEEPFQGRLKLDDGLPRYLTGIISNQLRWIDDESVREEIWELASTRLSERSGRTAMPSVHRTFSIPASLPATVPEISITLREPSLTGDNLGHKTWAASYMLAKRLPLIRETLPAFSAHEPKKRPAVRVLELGAGTGLVGIAAASTFATHVDLTDLPEICGNLAYNCLKNETVIHEHGGSTSAFPLDWSDLPPEQGSSVDNKYDVILAADSLYSSQHPAMLTSAIVWYLKPDADSRVIVELPLREAYQPEIDDFKRLMKEKGLKMDDDDEETGYDDWEDGSKEVRCWWGVWSWERIAENV